MREKGVFLNTVVEDLKVTYMNFGWETEGTFLAAIRVRNISLRYVSPDRPARTRAIPLLRDQQFSGGFVQRGSVISRDTVDMLMVKPGKMPVWHLAQWYSNHVLTANDLALQPGGSYEFSNEVNSITRQVSSEGESVLELAASGQVEWGDSVRQPGDPWPHMLISQGIGNCPPLDRLDELILNMETRVRKWELFREDQYDPEIQAARYRLNFIVKNVNSSSEGYNDYFWFVMTLFDNRHEWMPGIAIKDKGSERKQASGKFIYSPPADRYLPETLHNLDWVELELDILPFILEGLEKAGELGYLTGNGSPEDFSVTYFNIGYELTAAIEIESQLRNLEVTAYEFK